ncbi:hypothetical protein LEP1GSC058_0071 [Leptospira fainei serovar Hurstbridge str. BUT 6]|uniref:Uncharacterized protein n=1 Tax=Leptospira fainei serovar Hurstbridge str. BUT 6 TaxID=1193011 RepID=S3V3F8_9LEPT|nr:hypothetical protein LEP1GSC058_0071 [Leptospira fainei serovar Hurstbridge str. BUT 6]
MIKVLPFEESISLQFPESISATDDLFQVRPLPLEPSPILLCLKRSKKIRNLRWIFLEKTFYIYGTAE